MNKENNQVASKNKKIPKAFFVILVLIPLFFFALLEIGLRAVNYGTNYSLFHKPEGYVPGMLYVNSDRSFKYFGNLKGAVFFHGIGFSEVKPKNCFRVFVLGGSSAQGFPYAQNASFPSHLSRRLEMLYPNQLIEVVNLGASAINSHTLLDILPEVLEQSPDLILIYAGHNEYYGALGPGSSNTFSSNPSFVKVLLHLKTYRLIQFIQNNLSKIRGQKNNNESLMQTMIGESFIPKNSKIYDAGISQFESNLEDILSMIKDANVQVVIGTLASNLSGHKPFNSDQTDELGWSAKDHFDKAQQMLIDSNFLEAKNHFIEAKEWDGLRFRAPEQMNRIILKLSGKYQIPVANVDSLFMAHSPLQIIGNQLMCDHLHPNMEGYFLLSKSFFSKMKEMKYLPKSSQNISLEIQDSLLIAHIPYTKIDSIHAEHTIINLIGSYPFVPIGVPNPYLSLLKPNHIVETVVAPNKVDSVRILVAGAYLKSGQIAEFSKEMNVLASYFPVKEHLYLNAIQYLEKEHLLDQAYPLVYEVLINQKNSISKSKMIGLYYEYRRENEMARKYFDEAIRMRPSDPLLLEHRAYVNLITTRYQEAIDDFSKVIDLDPTKADFYHQRGVAKFELKDYQGTIRDFDQVLIIKEDKDPMAYLILGYAYYGLKDTESACDNWRKASKLGHDDAKRLCKNYCKEVNYK